MPINTRESYIEIGTSVNADNTLNNVLRLPAPTELPSSDEYIVDAQRNAIGRMLIQEIGNSQYVTSIRWVSLPSKKWWEINRWFETYGIAFYMKYFSHTDGKVKIKHFYRGNVEKATPSPETEIINGYAVPKKYKGCGFNIIDTGDDSAIIINEMAV
jgi:hypothetical protein